MNQVAGKSYNFKDLARFVDDIKFLITRGGEGNPLQNETLTKKILGWIVFVVLILLIIYVLYLVYCMIFRGYSRTLRDFFTLSFSNQVDSTKIIGGEQGQLYKTLIALQNSKLSDAYNILANNGYPLVAQECEGDNCQNVFWNLFSIIDRYYEPDFGSEKNTKALVEYYMYFAQTQKHLSLTTLNNSRDRIAKMTKMTDSLYKYEELYNDILDIEVQLVCLENGTTDQEIKQKEEERKALKKTLKGIFDEFDIQPVITPKEFANYYTAPVYIARCGEKTLKTFYNEILESTDHEKLRKEVQKNVENIAQETQNLKRASTRLQVEEAKANIKDNKQKKLQNEILMARYRKTSQEQAEEQYRNQIADVIKTMTKKKSWEDDAKKAFKKVGGEVKNMGNKVGDFFKGKSTKKKVASKPQSSAQQSAQKVEAPKAEYVEGIQEQSIIRYESGDNEKGGSPLLNARKDGKQNKIYVPCYHIYHQYVIMNQSILRTPGMTDEELVAFLFMKDYQIIHNRSAEDTITYVPVLERILRMQIAMETIANMTFYSVNDVGKLRQYLYYIFIASDSSLSTAISDILRNQNIIAAYQQNNFDKILVTTKYSWYLMELLCMINPDNPLTFNTCFNQFFVAASGLSIDKMQTLNMYLNINNPPADLIGKLRLPQILADFCVKHPIFTTVYLSQVISIDVKSQNKSTRDAQLNNARNKSSLLYSQLSQFAAPLFPASGVWSNNNIRPESLNSSIDNFKNTVHALKEVFVHMHIVQLYLTEYKTTSGLKDKVKEERLVKDGFIELMSDQLITEKEFFMKLITPFKNDLIDVRVIGAWKELFYEGRFKYYWRDFTAYWIKYLRKKMEATVKNVWENVGSAAKTRFK